MNLKRNLSTFFIFVAIFISTLLVNAQNSADTIEMRYSGFGKAYYKDNIKLSLSEMTQLTQSIPKAYKLINQAHAMRVGSYFFSIPGGAALGFALGHGLGRSMVGAPINKPLFFSMLGAGAVFLGIGIGFEVGANNKLREGVAIFNNNVKQSKNANLNIDLLHTGMTLKLNF